MSDQILVFKVEGVEREIALDATSAPQTLTKVLETLPATVDIHCAKIAGSHIMWPVPFVQGVEKASDVLSMPPGAFFFWPERQYLEISYDALQAETAAVSYLGRVVGDIGWLRDYAERQRRGQGESVFTAEMFVRPSRADTTAPRETHGSAAFERLHEARLAAWKNQPTDVQALLDRRGLNIPFGPLAMAEGELRKLHELLWRLWNEGSARPEAEKAVIGRFIIEAAFTRVSGFCHMLETGIVLQDGLICLAESNQDLTAVLIELILYVGRMAAWLDLHISWWPINELTLRNINERKA